MKYASIILIGIAILAAMRPEPLNAQELSKAETKEIKAELKKFKKNPLLYKVKLQKLHSQIEECEGELVKDEKQTRDRAKAIRVLNDSIRLMHTAIDMLVEEMEMMASSQPTDLALEGTTTTSGKTSGSSSGAQMKTELPAEPEGLAYKVQVGQYRFLNISDYFTGPKVFNYEIVDGKYTYNIGYFDNLEDARRFATDIKKMGITDAFVTKYKKGVRLTN